MLIQQSYVLPAGACDCHTHVVGDRLDFPMVSQRFYTPALAPHEALLNHMKCNHLQRTVIVQPSFYGTDNSCMIESLIRLEGAGRGVAVVDDDADESTLLHLHSVGVRGLRLNVESAGVRDVRALEMSMHAWAERIAHLGWHLQIYATHQTISEIVPFLGSLQVPVVLDHFAMIPATTSSHDAALRSILELLASGNVYVKLSAPYRIAGTEPYVMAKNLAHALLNSNSERVLWGSDWPHTNREPGKGVHEVSCYRDIPAGTLSESIHSWLPTHMLRQQVLVNNPKRLYDF